MASLLLLRVALVLAVAHLGFGHTKFIRDGGRPSLKIFHHVCALKKDEGPCKAVRDRFYFDIDSGRCERFEYGGCQGNGNNFDTLEECEEMCVVRANKSPCHLEDEPGPCRGLVPRYFFDSKIQECKRFFYGGCFGNANNFKTLKECQATCQRTKADETRDAPKPSEATKPFTATLIKDDELIVEESHMQLHTQPRRESHADLTPQDFCLLPVVQGECDRSERRFAFNSRTKRCQAFSYSGCGGNRNKFISKKRCMKICMNGRGTQIRIKTKNSNILFRSI